MTLRSRVMLLLFVAALSWAALPVMGEETPGSSPGSDLRPVSRPAPSFDLLFLSERSGDAQLHRLDLVSGQVSALTRHFSPVHGPRWLAGRQAAVVAGEREGLSWLYQIEPDTQMMVPLFSNPAGDEVPDWSPAEDRWVYMKHRGEQRDIFLSAVGHGPSTALTDDPVEDKQPRWSPDGRRIVFVSRRDGNQDIFLMDPDDGVMTNITGHPAMEGHPCWSPDGDLILFYRYERGRADLLTMATDGSRVVNLTPGEGNELVGAWSPDGAWIAFGSDRTGDWELYLMRSDGTEVKQITHHAGFDGDPIWIPRIR